MEGSRDMEEDMPERWTHASEIGRSEHGQWNFQRRELVIDSVLNLSLPWRRRIMVAY
jgi:hypothetical protein